MFKKFSLALVILAFLFIAASAHAIEWTVANQSTVAWNEVTETAEGKPFAEGDEILYGVYIVKEGADKSTATKLDETDKLEYTITFSSEGRWLAGVETIRIPAASPTDRQLSPKTWSDVVDVAKVPVPFGFIYFAAPKQVGGLGPK